MASTAELPDGLSERTPEWHMDKIIEFTQFKALVGEPSPHLAIMGYFCKDCTPREAAWRLACYAATYCLPTAQVIWQELPLDKVAGAHIDATYRWLHTHWEGIVTRQERRCVRTPLNMAKCLVGAARWADKELQPLLDEGKSAKEPKEFYDRAWKSVMQIPFFGRYIAIRYIEGLRRYCGLPAALYDVRSVGGWSPKKCLVYLYPEHADLLLTESAEGNKLTDFLVRDLATQFSDRGAPVDFYVLAAMLCEYKGAFENRHQYPGWTIDQEPLLYSKVEKYWSDIVGLAPLQALWAARASLFPSVALGEISGWDGTRWPLTKTLRDHGYNWVDTMYDYTATEDVATPVRREV